MITNINIRKYLALGLIILTVVGIADLAFWLFGGDMLDFFNGYSAIIIPLLILFTYVYIGFPIFSFDAKSDMLHLRSHMVLNKYLGKDLYVPRKNIAGLNIDTSGIRKKLIVRYIKDGREYEEKFGVTLLNNKKIRKLDQIVKNIDAEAKNISNTHLFI